MSAMQLTLYTTALVVCTPECMMSRTAAFATYMTCMSWHASTFGHQKITPLWQRMIENT